MTESKPSAAELREQKEARVAAEQAKMTEAREKLAAEDVTDVTDVTADAGSRSGPRADAQYGLFDKVIEDEGLEAALESREKVKASRSALNAKFKEADDAAKGLIGALGLENGIVVRVGRFKIETKDVAPREVEFKTGASERLTIAPIKQDD